ncbi:5-formyltetrahydrofolate cyclo-ligase [Clostridium sp. PL3]|uniref:5-formyltetrahydrofolate cyclo-ligase n=1 Tax=Clostridium thailandense TaxID=2794346 RepID=A0A949U177_9CLOT|nr:5-formyltetrahydrofolate cyclo-ligase [Clostridium thailandense]MBV7274573.1 5-formyltetrahydrofolate cyclo-ligase [Clostridium thailandense]
MESKKDIRKSIKSKRAALTNDEREKLNKALYEKTINSEYYKNANTIFAFVSYDTEVDTHSIIKKALEDGKTVCVPKTISMEEGMLAIKLNSFNDMAEGNYGILEPKLTTPKIEENLIDLAFIPGLAFDKRGGRVGYGGGFYDRFMNNMRKEAKKIGLAYSFQILDEVPMEKHDLFIDGIITD